MDNKIDTNYTHLENIVLIILLNVPSALQWLSGKTISDQHFGGLKFNSWLEVIFFPSKRSMNCCFLFYW